MRIEEINLRHLAPSFDSLLVSDIDSKDIRAYQNLRLAEGAAPKTVNLEVGTIRSILRRHRLWANLQPDVQMLKTADDTGKAISVAEQSRLLERCSASRSKALYPAVMVALNTGMRLRRDRWAQMAPS